ALKERLEADGTPVTTVVHAAGVASGGSTDELDADTLAAQMDAKVSGAAHLDSVFADAELDAFVLFSSIAGVWGGGGQAGYAAANAYLDGLAEARRARGQAAVSLAWGPWADGGMADEDTAAALARRGLTAMAADTAVLALDQALSPEPGEACVTVADVDWTRFVPPFTARRPSPLLAELPEVAGLQQAPSSAGAGADAALRGRLAGLKRTEQKRLLLGLVRERAADVLGHSGVDAITETGTFRELGFDSLTAVEFRNALAAGTGLTLAATLVFDYPSPAALTAHLLD
ncbi:beta-ketoacyl reductase, partial [Streptomyces sp. TRM70308]|uniref:beta-ketoacyl reductase n=1 Tax=Streptomyces sp. TRM70308 TaxID=3131932 RepID=UPI003D084239